MTAPSRYAAHDDRRLLTALNTYHGQDFETLARYPMSTRDAMSRALAAATGKEQEVLDEMAALLFPESDDLPFGQADLLDRLRDLVSATDRPHPSGDYGDDEYAPAFRDRTGRDLPDISEN